MHEVTPSVYTLDSLRPNQGVVFIAGRNEPAMPRQEGVPGRPAEQGEYISIFANGLGATDEDVLPGAPAPLDRIVRVANRIRLFIGGIEVEPLFAGLAPGQIGLYQIDARVPEGTPVGGEIPLYVEIVLRDGSVVTSNTVAIAIGEPPAP
jgi:uncharacterized protein (TIGR03437 family)